MVTIAKESTKREATQHTRHFDRQRPTRSGEPLTILISTMTTVSSFMNPYNTIHADWSMGVNHVEYASTGC